MIQELEEENRQVLSQWQQAPMLKGELVLLLDASLKTHLGQAELQYDRRYGLTYRKEESYEGNCV